MRSSCLTAFAVLVCASLFAENPTALDFRRSSADLRLVKTLVRPPSGATPALFDLVVTNYGPNTAAGPITIDDQVPQPATLDTSGVPAPWNCVGNNTSHATCVHPGPLTVGNSLTITLGLQSNGEDGSISNCAYMYSPAFDPDLSNNNDCACVDFKLCRDVTIDVSTGVVDTNPLAFGATDPRWVVTKTPGGSTPPAVVVAEPNFVALPPAQWITADTSTDAAAGEYIYDFSFTLGHEFDGRVPCQVNVQYAVDNEAAFFLDNASTAFTMTPGFTTLPGNTSSFTTVHTGLGSLPGSFGKHVLHLHVINGGGSNSRQAPAGPTSVIVRGSISCSCSLPPTCIGLTCF